MSSIPAQNEAAASNASQRQGDATGDTEGAQTRFLQHFISDSLGSELPQQPSRPAHQVDEPLSRETTSNPSEAGGVPYVAGQSDDMFAAAIKMVVALGAIIILLLVGSYFLRRYVLLSQSATKQEPLLRLVSKVPITTKSILALVEVPGKLILIGVAGNNLTALGEVQAETKTVETTDTEMEQKEIQPDQTGSYDQPVETSATSFAASLEQYTKLQAAREQSKDNILTVQETIQQKVSGLKRL